MTVYITKSCDDQEVIDFFTDSIDYKNSMFGFVRKHDCYLNPPDIEMEEDY